MTTAVDRDLEIARAVARRNLNWTTWGAIAVLLVLIAAVATGAAPEPPVAADPEPPSFKSLTVGLATFAIGPAATLLLTRWLGRLYVARLTTPRVGYGMLALIAVVAVVAGYFVTTSTWMAGILIFPEKVETSGSGFVAALDVLGEFLAQAGAFGLVGLAVTGWVTIPLAVLISIGAAAATNREIASRIAARDGDGLRSG